VRQKDIIKSKFRLIGAAVITKDGKKLGRVKNFTLDYESFKVSELHINPRIIKRIVNESLIIDRRQILEVRNDKIIIKSAAIKSNEKSINVLPAKAY
jgi:sporulation protein YlmC with PRC-barrel domain